MSRISLRALLIPLLLAMPIAAPAGQTPSAAPKTSGGKSEATTAPAVNSSGVMQIKKQITGDFSYRFLSGADKTTAAATAPLPLPAPAGADNIVALAIPSSIGMKDGLLEILDNSRGNLARLPIDTKSVSNLTESSFNAAQRVNVPVQAKGLGVVGAQVTMTSASKKYSQSWLLQADDNGIARFTNVPLNEPVTVTVSYGSNPPESQTKTLTTSRPAEAWPPILVTWADAKTVTPPPVAAPQPTTTTGRDTADSRRGPEDETRPTHQPESNPLASLVSAIVSLLFVGAVGYGLFWAYKTGHMKTALDRLGINTEPMAAAPAGAADPFAKPVRAPIQPITEGTADPFGGSLGGSVTPVSAADGPRLIATAGAYAGNIFPLNGPAMDIGRDAGNAVALPNDTNASRRHATLQAANGQYLLTDNGSSNGTFVNGVRIASQTPQPLRPGDEVQVGMTRFRFEA